MWNIKLILGVLFLIIGLWISFLNWQCFYKGVLLKKKSSSLIPFLGGIFLSIGIWTTFTQFNHFWWLSFFIDFGSIPGVGYNIIYRIFYRK